METTAHATPSTGGRRVLPFSTLQPTARETRVAGVNRNGAALRKQPAPWRRVKTNSPRRTGKAIAPARSLVYEEDA